MNNLLVHLDDVTDGKLSPSQAAFQAWAKALDALLSSAASVCLRLVNEPEMIQLNETYRGKTGSTNVLAFGVDSESTIAPENDAEFDDEFLGDLAICVDVVEQERLEQKKSRDAHWAHLFIHGMLHLLGHDHQCDEEAEKMERLETQLLRSLNFPAPYETN